MQNRQSWKETKGSTEGDSESANGDYGREEWDRHRKKAGGWHSALSGVLNLEPPVCLWELLSGWTWGQRGTNLAGQF